MRRHFDPFVTKEMLRKASLGGMAAAKDERPKLESGNPGIRKSWNPGVGILESGQL